MPISDPAREQRAQEIFERETNGALSWSPATEPAPGAIATVDEDAKDKYRKLASKELAAEGRS
jgi:hypothetical protein